MPGDLTELESCTLGLIQRLQPCSTYQIRRVFASSPTTEWSASAGSIYPVIERLLRLRLVSVRSRIGARRGRRDLALTKEGARAIRAWIRDLEPWAARATSDPIRTRAYFLESLKSRRDRAAFLSRAEELTRVMIRELRSYAAAERGSSEADYRVSVAARFQLEARLKWLRTVRAVQRRS